MLLWLVACDQGAADKRPPPPSPPSPIDGDITCGKSTCHANQVCITEQAGHTCWRDRPDIGDQRLPLGHTIDRGLGQIRQVERQRHDALPDF